MKVLFLTTDSVSDDLLKWLQTQDEVLKHSEKVDVDLIKDNNIDIVVAYNYFSLIRDEVIEEYTGKIINLHPSLIPWNKGSDSNVWSFIDNTPKGVTIHYMSKGIDEGDILLQEELNLSIEEESFNSASKKLHSALTLLFINNWDDIKNGNIVPIPQKENGTYHTHGQLAGILDKTDCDAKISTIIHDLKAKIREREAKL